jgi:hypothetical protein
LARKNLGLVAELGRFEWWHMGNIFIKGDMMGDENSTRSRIKTAVTFVIVEKTEMNTRKRMWC